MEQTRCKLLSRQSNSTAVQPRDLDETLGIVEMVSTPQKSKAPPLSAPSSTSGKPKATSNKEYPTRRPTKSQRIGLHETPPQLSRRKYVPLMCFGSFELSYHCSFRRVEQLLLMLLFQPRNDECSKRVSRVCYLFANMPGFL